MTDGLERRGQRERRRQRRRRLTIAGVVAAVVAGVACIGLVAAALGAFQQGPTEPPIDTMVDVSDEPVATEPPVALWVGDSYTNGVGTTSVGAGEACRSSEQVGWVCLVDAQGSTGFLSAGVEGGPPGATLGDRLSTDADRYTPDVVVIDAGRNDGPLTPELRKAIGDYYTAAREAFPRAVIVQVAPYWFGHTFEAYPSVTAAMAELIGQVDGYLVDPVAEGWTDPEKVRGLAWTDEMHPNADGHLYIADHLAANFERLGILEAVESGARR